MLLNGLQWLRLCKPQKALPTELVAAGATASSSNPTHGATCSLSLLLPPGFPPSHTPLSRFSHHHGAHKAAVHKQSGALAKWVLTSVPAPVPSLPHTDEACRHVLCPDSRFQPICNHPPLPPAPTLSACARTDSSVKGGMKGSRQGDKSPKELSSHRKRRAEQHFTSAPQHGCSPQTGAE